MVILINKMPYINPIKGDLLTFFILLFGIIIFIAISELLRAALRWHPETTRKLVHVGTGFLVYFSPLIFYSIYPPLVLSIIFICVNFLGIKFNLMKGMHSTERTSYGTVFYPISFLILLILFWYRDPAILMTSMLILALADPLAAAAGERAKNPRMFIWWKERKSIQGSVTMAGAAFIITFLSIKFLRDIDSFPPIHTSTALWISIIAALFLTLMEALSAAGSDNISIPLGSAFILDFMLRANTDAAISFSFWFLFSIFLAAGAYRLKFLDSGGSAGALILGTIIFGTGGLQWMIPLVFFFILSSILSKIGKERKESAAGIFEKTSIRDLYQVGANGGVAGISALLWHYMPSDLFYFSFLGALAAATADTWGTETGILSGKEPRLIINFEKVPPGKSGGITAIGMLGAISGAVLLALSGGIYISGIESSFWRLQILTAIILSGIMASIIDSIAGATVQAQYRCSRCGKVTEKRIHCGLPIGEPVSGLKWINNDMVNLICTLSGALFVPFLISIL